jgi:hypothetical protein
MQKYYANKLYLATEADAQFAADKARIEELDELVKGFQRDMNIICDKYGGKAIEELLAVNNLERGIHE